MNARVAETARQLESKMLRIGVSPFTEGRTKMNRLPNLKKDLSPPKNTYKWIPKMTKDVNPPRNTSLATYTHEGTRKERKNFEGTN